MVLLCYVNLSGMQLECMVIVLMNNSLLGGQECTDSVDIQESGNRRSGGNSLEIIPRLNFTCSGRITRIRARIWFIVWGTSYPFFQVWRQSSVDLKVYTKIGEVQLQSGDQWSVVNDNVQIANINLTAGTNIIEVQSGDIVGYYHPFNPRFSVITRETDGYMLYQFSGSHESVDLDNIDSDDRWQPVIQFTIGKCVAIQPPKTTSYCLKTASKLTLLVFVCLITDTRDFKVTTYSGSC